jgi:hypothetical protein
LPDVQDRSGSQAASQSHAIKRIGDPDFERSAIPRNSANNAPASITAPPS